MVKTCSHRQGNVSAVTHTHLLGTSERSRKFYIGHLFCVVARLGSLPCMHGMRTWHACMHECHALCFTMLPGIKRNKVWCCIVGQAAAEEVQRILCARACKQFQNTSRRLEEVSRTHEQPVCYSDSCPAFCLSTCKSTRFNNTSRRSQKVSGTHELQ
jgi:hypothetical protein